MRGHQSIAEARANGYHPKHVWVILVDAEQPKAFTPVYDPELMLENGFIPEVHIYKGDRIERVDLRCISGMTVHLVADDTTNLEKAAKALMRFKPASVYACNAKQFIQHHHTEKQA